MKLSVSPWFLVVGALMWWVGEFPFFLALVVVVLVHEFSHIMVARHFGVRVERLRLLPFGAQIQIDVGFLTQRQRLLILLAGVGGNIVFALSLGLFLWLFPAVFLWIEPLIIANAIVVAMNLLPIWPLDGGKILGLRKGRSTKLMSRFKPKKGRVVEIRLLPTTTLFEAYKMVDSTAFTKFLLGDKIFYENQLEDLMIRHDIYKTLGEIINSEDPNTRA
ncbi:MAG: site-2 protease family protein [Firmicutes bacterium]|nr:site-2 protease family protein [Bacillota bacterium]